ncbi:MAG: hypothetical protein ABEJ04_07255 [Halobacteriaceae archaeon]
MDSDAPSRDPGERPEFETKRLHIDAARAREVVGDTLSGVTATETAEGVKFRTTDGSLIAVLTDAEDGGVEVHYRTAPASSAGTRKGRRLWRALEPYSV